MPIRFAHRARLSVLLSALVTVLLVPMRAYAAPADRVVSMRTGGAVTERLSQPVRIHVDDPEIAGAEQLPSMEVRIEGHTPGVTWVFLHGDEGLTAWQVRVSTPVDARAQEAAVASARAACPDLERTRTGVVVRVVSASCHRQVVALGEHFEAEALSVRFDADGLQAQIRAQEARLGEAHPELASRVQIAYLGVTLRLTGRLDSPEDRDAVLRTLWRSSAGRLLVDLDRLEVGDPS